MRIAAPVLLALAACSPSGSPEPTAEIRTLPATVTLAPGESRVVNDVTITFVTVRDDSRCPSDVQCVWAGNAELVLRIGADSAKINSYLDPKSVTAAGLTVTYVSLEPDPVSTKPTTGYRAELRIETAIR